MVTQRKEIKLDPVQKDLVNSSVKAQNMLLKQGFSTYKTTDDLNLNISVNNNQPSVMQPGTNITSNVSQEDPSKIFANFKHGDQLLFPSIRTGRKNNDQSPILRGYLDISQTSQKMKQQVIEQKMKELSQTKGIKNLLFPDGLGAIFKEEKSRYKSVERASGASKMNPKVLETWINETLQDAEHLDIPGVILKPEHKNPISRYGIDRLNLTNSGIPNELVDRIFRALFVYSVGFYELIKKCLQHCDKKYSIITNIWKVFSILLEYCCKTDYRMLIAEISKEHKLELERVEREMQAKFYEQQENEKLLKSNIEILQKYNEDLEKQRNQEMQARLKLEEEYMQNTKNHEEEVQLRLKFESKLNNMHSVHRELETKYKRLFGEYSGLVGVNDQLNAKQAMQLDEITKLKTIQAENESKIAYNEEKMNAIQREINIKIKQVQDYEQRYTKTHDELDNTKYKLSDAQKNITELKLRIDMFESQISTLQNEKQHLQYEVKETKNLLSVYEKKTGSLMVELNKTNLEFQESKREIIGFNELQKEREDRIDKMKQELRELKLTHEKLDLEHGTLQIQFEKVKEQYESTKYDLNDVIDKLHVTNKVRHETEIKLDEELQKNKNMAEIIREKDELNNKRVEEIEDLDKKVIELERQCEALEIKKVGLERQFELTKKQLNEKIINMNEVLATEKETRETWIERYEKEQREHTHTNAQLLQVRSQLKDQVLATRNAEIKLQSQVRANEVIQEANGRLQDQLNETLAKNENLERDLNTQKEIMKQMDISKKEYIQKLKLELEEAEKKFNNELNTNNMIGEEYHSQAQENYYKLYNLTLEFEDLKLELENAKELLEDKSDLIQDLQTQLERKKMIIEDYHQQFYNQTELYIPLKEKVLELEEENESQIAKVEKLQDLLSKKEGIEIELNELKRQVQEYRKNDKTEKKDVKDRYKRGQGHGSSGPGQGKKVIKEGQSHNTSNATCKESVEQGVQTLLSGPNLEQMMRASGAGAQQMGVDQNTKITRIGGGGEIRRKQPRKNNVQNSNQNPQLGISGLPQPLQTKNSMQVNLGLKEMVDQVLDLTPKDNQQYPQTTTHQTQRLIQFPSNSNNQQFPLPKPEDGPQTQHPTPRHNEFQSFQNQLSDEGQRESTQQSIQHDQGISQRVHQIQTSNKKTNKQIKKDFNDIQTASSVQNSQNTFNNTLGQPLSSQRPNFQQLNLQDQHIAIDNSIMLSPGSNALTLEESTRDHIPLSNPQQQNFINDQNVIYEQINEEEERKTPNYRSRLSQIQNDSNIQQRRKSIGRQSSERQSQQNIQQRKSSSQNKAVRGIIGKLNQGHEQLQHSTNNAPAFIQQQPIIATQQSSQSQVPKNISSNQDNFSSPYISSQQDQTFQNDTNQKRKISLKGENQSDRQSEFSAQLEEHKITPTQQYQQKMKPPQVYEQKEPKMSTESIEEIVYQEDDKKKESFFPEIPQRKESIQYPGTRRMKVDILDTSSAKKSMNSNVNILSPQSQTTSGFMAQSNLNQLQSERQQYENKQVKGKSSIRTLIKSAATRDQ